MAEPRRPLPKPDEDTEPFWEACRQKELRMQRCLECGTLRFRPRVVCPSCLSEQSEWALLSGRGIVHTFGVVYSPILPAFKDELPYTIALVDLDEGPRMTTRIVECAPGDVFIGMPVEVCFVPVAENVTLPCFRPALPGDGDRK